LFVVIEDLPDRPLARHQVVRQALLPVLADLPGDISLIAKTPAEVAANLTALLLDVCADGICLFGADFFEPYRSKGLAAIRQAKLRRHRSFARSMWLFPRVPTSTWELTWEGYRERA